ncbi:19908_t:CDS:2, partial [Rhizophagus irregularis]
TVDHYSYDGLDLIFKERIVMMEIETKHTTCGKFLEFGSSKEVLDVWTRDGERNLSPFSITLS